MQKQFLQVKPGGEFTLDGDPGIRLPKLLADDSYNALVRSHGLNLWSASYIKEDAMVEVPE